MGNRIQDAFDNIKADSSLKESTKVFLAEKREKKNSPFQSRAFYRTFAAVCTILLLTVGIGGYWWAQVPVSYVSIDINPSVELGLNRLERVVSATAYNPEGEEILQELSLKGKKYTEAIHAVVESQAMARYLTKDAELVFTVAAEGSREKEIETGVAYCSKHIGHKCHRVSADMEIVSSAHDNEMSVGKYYAYLQLSQYDSAVSLDECRHMSMQQIHDSISEHEQENGHHKEAEQEIPHEENRKTEQEDTDEESSKTEQENTDEKGGHHQKKHHE